MENKFKKIREFISKLSEDNLDLITLFDINNKRNYLKTLIEEEYGNINNPNFSVDFFNESIRYLFTYQGNKSFPKHEDIGKDFFYKLSIFLPFVSLSNINQIIVHEFNKYSTIDVNFLKKIDFSYLNCKYSNTKNFKNDLFYLFSHLFFYEKFDLLNYIINDSLENKFINNINIKNKNYRVYHSNKTWHGFFSIDLNNNTPFYFLYFNDLSTQKKQFLEEHKIKFKTQHLKKYQEELFILCKDLSIGEHKDIISIIEKNINFFLTEYEKNVLNKKLPNNSIKKNNYNKI